LVAHRNISIRGNRITDSVLPNLHVTSTDGLVIKDNTLMSVPVDAKQQPIRLEKCKSVHQALPLTTP